MSEHLRAAGHHVQVLSATPATAAGEIDGGIHRDLPRFPVTPAPTDVAVARHAEREAAAALSRRLAAFRPDVVCLWRLGELSMSLPTRVAAAGVPLVGVVCDAWMLDGAQRDPWSRLHSAPRLPEAARWLFVSEALRDQLAGAGARAHDGDIVPAGVDLAAFALARMKRWRGRLLYVGRLSPLKGIDIAIEALARLSDGFTLEIVGDGPPDYVRELRRAARLLGVSRRVRFHGHMPRHELPAIYAAADAVLFPIRWPEPFGLVPLEAMACGTPVVAVAAGGATRHLHDGETALVVPPEDPRALAAAVERLAADPALRKQLRYGGRRAAERYPARRTNRAITAALEAASCAQAA